jgi:hypothetical protein
MLWLHLPSCTLFFHASPNIGSHLQTVPCFTLRSFILLGLDSTYEQEHVLSSFSAWLNSLNKMISTSIHFSANNIISFFFVAEEYSYICLCIYAIYYIILFIMYQFIYPSIYLSINHQSYFLFLFISGLPWGFLYDLSLLRESILKNLKSFQGLSKEPSSYRRVSLLRQYWHLGGVTMFSMGVGWPVHHRMFSSIPDLSPQDVHSIPSQT